MDLTQVNTSYYLGQSYHMGRNNNIQWFIQGAPNPPVAITGVPVVKSFSWRKENNQPKILIKSLITKYQKLKKLTLHDWDPQHSKKIPLPQIHPPIHPLPSHTTHVTHAPTVNAIFTKWINGMYFCTKKLILFPDKETMLQIIPPVFKKHFANLRCIIDCSEVFIQGPTNYLARSLMYSRYKKHTIQ